MPTDIDLAQLDELLAGRAQLVEVLPAVEYDEEHLPDAINIPLKTLHESAATRLDRDRPGPRMSEAASSLGVMTRKVWTAAELEALDPAEVDAIFEEGIIWDAADAPQELLARTRERILRRIEETEPTQPS